MNKSFVPLIYEFKVQHVNLAIFCAVMEDAYLMTCYVIGYLIALMVETKRKHYVSRAPSSLFAQMAGAKTWKMFVTEKITAKITATKIKSVLVSHLNKKCPCKYKEIQSPKSANSK